MPTVRAAYKPTDFYAVVSVLTRSNGTTEVKTYGPFSYIEKALSEKRKLLSNDSVLTSQYLRKQAQIYVLPMFRWTQRTEI